MSIKPLMRYHGAKWRLAPWIISHFPQHHCYVEPFGGSAAVLISKEPSSREVYNDKNFEIVNLFNVIRDDEMRTQLLRLLVMTPYSRTEFEFAKEVGQYDTPVMIALKLLVRAQMGFGSAGATRGNTGFRLDTARGGTSLQSLWSDLPANVLNVTERLRNVVIENTDAYNVIKQHDRSNTLFYLDPPYTLDTRTNKDSYGKFEMREFEHTRLLELTLKSKGMFVISGYDNELYNDTLAGWTKSSRQTAISSRNGSGKRTEVLWISPNCEQQQTDLFGFEEISA
ncbi:DNA adenine methylase [Psychrobacter sp. Marseille-P5312]|uniref:DNA adenine methylase n=1 Tax=Psychrobacter sp. Marseille-P5312 TaxID=2086574 RepID=UPI000CF69212|nr:DNA adenine methylase [Psychrobacter sp. Marseille-P5312]